MVRVAVVATWSGWERGRRVSSGSGPKRAIRSGFERWMWRAEMEMGIEKLVIGLV